MTGFSLIGEVLAEATGIVDPLGIVILLFGIPLVASALILSTGAPRRGADQRPPLVWHRGPSWEGVVPQAAPAPVGDYVVCLSCGLMARREPGAILPEGWAWSLWRIGEARTFRYACSTACTRILL